MKFPERCGQCFSRKVHSFGAIKSARTANAIATIFQLLVTFSDAILGAATENRDCRRIEIYNNILFQFLFRLVQYYCRKKNVCDGTTILVFQQLHYPVCSTRRRRAICVSCHSTRLCHCLQKTFVLAIQVFNFLDGRNKKPLRCIVQQDRTETRSIESILPPGMNCVIPI